ncbi:DUF2357 domain-containing protein [Flavobacterium sp. F52]|uniref:DUF2357 domain-containing protein n=1 Tax=Flavobacterium sp. F52 TaxID=1202532 RepID=UPI000272FAA2|nr:DUF2357 domain-containing protein [Flavobacterium sp. F52]EJG01276.1 hypothetical protein FF52_13476 [Flavobacterium sp. F52]
MEEIKKHIRIPLTLFNETDFLEIYPENMGRLFEISEEEANENGESIFQILEGNSYEYAFTDKNYRLNCSIDGLVSQSKREHSIGRIVPNIYVGTLTLFVSNTIQEGKEFEITIEVLATKFDTELDKSYRENYRFMLKDITDKCTELLMQINSPIEQNFETDFSRDNETIYQRFSFVNSIIQNKDFEEAILKIITSPKTHWNTEAEEIDIRKVKRFDNATTKQISSGSNRILLQTSHPLFRAGIQSIPNKINSFRKVEHTDTSENRFVKHALDVFLRFAEDCQQYFKDKKYSRPHIEASNLVTKLDGYLSHSFFKDISRPTSLKLNSPVLQRKSGYREVLCTWLQFDLAAKLIWKGGEDVYKAGKRDIATLYEYWLFFTLYDLFKSKFKIKDIEHEEQSYNHLIEPTKDGLNVMVKQGKHTALYGDFITENRALKVKFSYNRSFKGGIKYTDEQAGSYTTTLRPDYTLSVWPAILKEKEAERQDLIVHIHFDAKYKVTQFQIQTSTDNDLIEQEENNERKGIYKNADLLKMHAYKDAIRRSGGAYVLYPGTEKKEIRGFHEIIPGLGAFSINPTGQNNDITELSKFIDLVIEHLLDRASQRENINYKARSILQTSKEDSNLLHEPIPEYLNGSKLIPDETFVLVGYSKTSKRFDWYNENKKYFFRMNDTIGSLELTNEVVNAKYLLLRRNGQETAFDLYEIKSNGLQVYSKDRIIELNFPQSNNLKEHYLKVDIEKVTDLEFENVRWNFKELDEYKKILETNKNIYTQVGMPFTVSLTKLMKTKEIK